MAVIAVKPLQTYQLAHPNTQYTYPRICVHKRLSRDHAIRLVMPDNPMLFFDQLQGVISGNPQREQGDIVVRRRIKPSFQRLQQPTKA